jgi:hypothetical protein
LEYISEASSEYDIKCLSFGFTDVGVEGEKRPQFPLYMKVLDADSMKLNKLKTHPEKSCEIRMQLIA